MSDKPEDKAEGKDQDGKAGDKTPPESVPYGRFKEVNDERNALKAQLEAQAAERKRADEARLADEKKWEELAKTREHELATERLNRLRLKVALEHELPPDIADRLVGEDEAELKTDAEKLRQLLQPEEGPGNTRPARGGRSAALDIRALTPAQIREKKAELLRQLRSAAN